MPRFLHLMFQDKMTWGSEEDLVLQNPTPPLTMFGYQRSPTPESLSSPLLVSASTSEEVFSLSDILSSAPPSSSESYPPWEAASLDSPLSHLSPLSPLSSLSSLNANFDTCIPSLSDNERHSPTSSSSDYFHSPCSTSTSWSVTLPDSWPSSSSELDELEWSPPNAFRIRSIDEQCRTVCPTDVMPREDGLYANSLPSNRNFNVDSGYASSSASEYQAPKATPGRPSRKQAKAKRKVASAKIEEDDFMCVDQTNLAQESFLSCPAPKPSRPLESPKRKLKSEVIDWSSITAIVGRYCGEESSKLIEGPPILASPEVACLTPSRKRKRGLGDSGLPTATLPAPEEEGRVERPRKMTKVSPTPFTEEVKETRKPRRGRPRQRSTPPPRTISSNILEGALLNISKEELDDLVSRSRVGGASGCEPEDPSSWQPTISTRKKETKYVCRLCPSPGVPIFSTQHRMKSHYTGKKEHGFITPSTLFCQECEDYQTSNSSDFSRHKKSSKCRRAALFLAVMRMPEDMSEE